jgi:hypothetical protein
VPYAQHLIAVLLPAKRRGQVVVRYFIFAAGLAPPGIARAEWTRVVLRARCSDVFQAASLERSSAAA